MQKLQRVSLSYSTLQFRVMRAEGRHSRLTVGIEIVVLSPRRYLGVGLKELIQGNRRSLFL